MCEDDIPLFCLWFGNKETQMCCMTQLKLYTCLDAAVWDTAAFHISSISVPKTFSTGQHQHQQNAKSVKQNVVVWLDNQMELEIWFEKPVCQI